MTTHGCAKCDNRWSGYNTAHCAGCHETFSTVGAFDKHRTGSHADSTRHCVPPADAGLVLLSRDYRCWGRNNPQYAPNYVQASAQADEYALVITLIEIPQVCSLKFPTCEQRSV